MVDILDDGGKMKVVEDVVNREIVVIEVLSSELSNGGAFCNSLNRYQINQHANRL
jgi:hypothetical protein